MKYRLYILVLLAFVPLMLLRDVTPNNELRYLSKGPLGLLLPLAGTVTFLFATRRGRTLWRYWGFTTWAVLAVLSAAWFLAAYLEGGSSYLHNLLFHQTVDRAVD